MQKAEIKQTLTLLGTLLHSYHVRKIGLFGSCVRNEQNEDSDIDLLVEFDKPVDLFAYANLVDELSKAIDHKVDIVSVHGIKPALKNKILNEVEWIEGL